MKYELKLSFDTKEELMVFLAGMGQPTHQAQPAQQQVQQVQQSAPQTQNVQPVQSAQPAVQPTPQIPVAQPAQPVPQTQPITPAQPATKQYTKDELARACATVMDKPEGMQMLQELLAYYKVVSLNDLDATLYADFADKLRNLGVAV